eukprot:CAMPEP_0194560938 /NCGR_PEP_ID=MMETSP0292-20121207/1922_1 /TAXON_ID=39354 /ORGANISM="Heterosigma akashiwo, Strain CCMP2393" /LENGTH=266 /DNA_ID=CAMNT_0039409225 /DNA_START=14 /DNA_END=814 /DNA_ORIENTATION=+
MATVVRASTFLEGTGKCFLPKLCGVLTGKKHFSVTVATGSPSVFMMKGMDQETMTSELAKYMGNADLLQKSQSSFIPPESFGYELPEDGLAAPEFALVGRSNVGKSTLLGALLGDPALATVSKTPGCTRSINYFGVFPPTGLAGGGGDRWQGGMRSGSRNGGRTKSLVPRLYVVDLPGYGFAKAGKAAINGWQATMRRFLGARPPAVLRRVFVLVDARRGRPSAEDHRTMALLDEAADAARRAERRGPPDDGPAGRGRRALPGCTD